MEVDCQCVFPPPKGLDLDCSICFESLYVDPYQNVVCGHHFCGSCAHKLREEGQPCPVCRQPLNIIQDLGLQRTLKSLQVYCNNKDKGCQWEGELGGLQDHCTDEHNGCLYSEVHCTNNCGYRGLRHTIRDHMESDCPYRPMRCEYCEYQSTWEEVTGVHVDMCQLYPVTCVCGIVMTRTDLTNHKGINCPNDKIECEFADYKCEWQGERQQLHDHLQENWRSHLELVAIEIKTDFDTKTESLHKKVNELEERIDILEAIIESQKEEMELLQNKADKAEKLEEKIEAQNDKITERLLDSILDHLQYRMTILEEDMKGRLAQQFQELEDKWLEKLANDYKYTDDKSQQLKQETQCKDEHWLGQKVNISDEMSDEKSEENPENISDVDAISCVSASDFIHDQITHEAVRRVKSEVDLVEKRLTTTHNTTMDIQLPVVPKGKKTLQFIVNRWHHKRIYGNLHHSPVFYLNSIYKMQVTVHCNGYESGKGSHVSVYANTLSPVFPFVGDLVIRLHNQRSNDHLVGQIRFDMTTPVNKLIGIPKFVAFGDLEPYLRPLDDGLQFELPQVVL